jgi:hypothetical protein
MLVSSADKMSLDAAIEVHTVVSTNHKLTHSSGLTLTEEKHTTNINRLGSGSLLKKICACTRRIGDKSVTVTTETTEEEVIEKVESAMSTEELQEFNQQWQTGWTSSYTEEMIDKAIKDKMDDGNFIPIKIHEKN